MILNQIGKLAPNQWHDNFNVVLHHITTFYRYKMDWHLFHFCNLKLLQAKFIIKIDWDFRFTTSIQAVGFNDIESCLSNWSFLLFAFDGFSEWCVCSVRVLRTLGFEIEYEVKIKPINFLFPSFIRWILLLLWFA